MERSSLMEMAGLVAEKVTREDETEEEEDDVVAIAIDVSQKSSDTIKEFRSLHIVCKSQ